MTTPIAEAADHLFSLIARTRFRSPGTSADPYTDSLVLWLSVVGEVREILAPLDVPASVLGEVENIYRRAVEGWLRGDEITDAQIAGEMERVLDH